MIIDKMSFSSSLFIKFPLLFSGLLLTGCVSQYDASKDLKGHFEQMVGDYRMEAERLAEKDKASYRAADLPEVPSDFKSSSHNSILQSVQKDVGRNEYSLEQLYVSALKNSSQIKVFSDIPLIRETGIQEAQGVFDTTAFVEGSYDKTNEPVGSTLTTGGTGRFLQEEYRMEGGLRKKINTGAELSVSQEVSRTDNNSSFFLPDPQGGAELKLRLMQPLLKGAGPAYNLAVIRVAEIDSEIARQEFIRQAESHLLEITRSYWALYLARGLYQSKKNLARNAGELVGDLESRADLDAVKRQLLRARAADSERKADLIRSEASVRNAQDRLLALVNDPAMRENSFNEIIPIDAPIQFEVTADIRFVAAEALAKRPEISQGFQQLRAAAIREKMQRNEILPTLNLILEGSLAGLNEGGKYNRAAEKQFEEGGPGYMIGFAGEYPLENNIAMARLDRRKLELRQQFNQLKTTIETVLLEVKVSTRELKTSYRDLQAKYASYMANREDIDDLVARKDLMLGVENMSGSSYIEALLDTQERLAKGEDEYLRSLVTYNTAITNLERSKGTLLGYQNVTLKRGKDEDTDLPKIELEKTEGNKPVRVTAPAGKQKSKDQPATHSTETTIKEEVEKVSVTESQAPVVAPQETPVEPVQVVSEPVQQTPVAAPKEEAVVIVPAEPVFKASPSKEAEQAQSESPTWTQRAKTFVLGFWK
mgnify:CR=1 FL=1